MTDDEELLKAALEGPEEEPETDGIRRDIKSYIRMVGLVEGLNPIPASLVYQHYCKTYPKGHLGPYVFDRYFREVFPKVRIAYGMIYYLDPIALGLPSNYSIYTDKKYYPKTTQKSRKHGKEAENPEETEEQESYIEFIKAAGRKANDSEE